MQSQPSLLVGRMEIVLLTLVPKGFYEESRLRNRGCEAKTWSSEGWGG